jgi:hypothetical protein
MQRSAAKAVSNSPASPSTPGGPPSKRVRLSNGTASPATPSDHEVIRAALEAEEKKREDALEKATQNSSDTKWVLCFQDNEAQKANAMQVQHVGFGELDEGNSESEGEIRPSRMSFGGGLRKKKDDARDTAKSEEENTSSSGSDDEEDQDSDDPTAALIRETKREQARKEKAANRKRTGTQSHTPSRRKDDDDLSGLHSLSGGRPSGNLSQIECHNCGEKGHMQKDCSKRRKSNAYGSSGRSATGRQRH